MEHEYNISMTQEIVTKATYIIDEETGERELSIGYIKNYKGVPSYQVSNSPQHKKRKQQCSNYDATYGNFQKDLLNRILNVANFKYSGATGISPYNGREYYIFNDVPNTALKHYVDINTKYLSHSVMDFCSDPNSQPLCNNGKSDRYDLHEYTYTD